MRPLWDGYERLYDTHGRKNEDTHDGKSKISTINITNETPDVQDKLPGQTSSEISGSGVALVPLKCDPACSLRLELGKTWKEKYGTVKIYPAGALRRSPLHWNGNFVPPAPWTPTRRRVKTDFWQKTGRTEMGRSSRFSGPRGPK